MLGIETSCDETAVAIVEDGRKILSSVIASQVVEHGLYGGVVPEIASRRHIENINAVYKKALSEAGVSLADISGIAVTNAPGLIGALLVGLSFAKGLSLGTGLPLIPVHHIRGHIAANYLVYPDLKPPFLALVVSGGHSHIIMVEDYLKFKVIGRTRDDAAGEAFDKVARTMGLSYPGGVSIDKAARQGDKLAYVLPEPKFDDAPYDFSFSGLKTAVLNMLNIAAQKKSEINVADMSASFEYTVAGILTKRTFLAAEAMGVKKIVLAGGVSANTKIRQMFKEKSRETGTELFLPPLSLCGDNAAMIAAEGYYELIGGNIADMSLSAYANKSIE